MSHADLIARLEALEGPDRSTDYEILVTTTSAERRYYWEPDGRDHRFTDSIDAAVALAKTVLSGWSFDHMGQDLIRDLKAGTLKVIGWTAEITDGKSTAQGQAPTLPIALCIAILKALEAKEVQS